MTGRERIFSILKHEDTDRSGFWMGRPNEAALEIYNKYFGTKSLEELSAFMGDDIHWIYGEEAPAKRGGKIWDYYGGTPRVSLGQTGIFGDCENVNEVWDYEFFPDPDIYDIEKLRYKFEDARKRDVCVFSGMWSGIWHHLHGFMGMENCFIQMYTNPEIVHAIMRRLTDFYLQANEIFFQIFDKETDVFFMGNDLGSQLDCLIAPDMYREFIFPYFKEIINLAKDHGKYVAFHSCGAIDRLIPDLIKMGVDILHPIQAKARNMYAEHLKEEFDDKIIFMGGIDTQELLPYKTADDVERDVLRVRKVFGKHYICSPSHEAILKNVPPQNFQRLSECAHKFIEV